MRRSLILTFLAIASPAPVAAQPAPAPAATAAPALDPARIAAAERLVTLIMPPEIMERMMGVPLAGMDAVMDMTPDQLGIPADARLSAADRGRPMRELISRFDAHFRERLEIRNRVMMETLREVMLSVRPEMTRLMAEFYAGNLTREELDAAVAYYSTPAGRRFAGVASNISRDPAFTRFMTDVMPRFTRAMMTVEERVRAATAHLPPEPAPAAGANRH